MNQQPALIRLRLGQLDKYMALAGIKTNLALAKRMGNVSEATVSRFRNGAVPSSEVIAGLMSAFPALEFLDIFEVVSRDTEAEDAA